jgi:protein-L-isoaspartate(D-aspartate) O-methyltransferase
MDIVSDLTKEMMDAALFKMDKASLKKPSKEIIDAFYKVPRHLFTPIIYEEINSADDKEALKEVVINYNQPNPETLKKIYVDTPLVILAKENKVISTSSQPLVMSLMLRDLKIKPGNKVFEIGTGSGYNAALMAVLSGDSKNIISSEFNKEVVELAINNLKRAGYENIEVIAGDGGVGYSKRAPYDNIIATCGAPNIPWTNQLSENGTIAMPLVTRGIETLCSLTKQSDGTLKGHLSLFVRFLHLEGVYSDKQHFSKNIASLQRIVETRAEKNNDASKELEEILVLDNGEDKALSLQKSKKRSKFEFFLALTDENAMTYISDIKNHERGYALWHTGKEASKHGLAVIFSKEIISFGNEATTKMMIDSFNYWKKLGEPGINDYEISFYPTGIDYASKEDGWEIKRKHGTTVFNLKK